MQEDSSFEKNSSDSSKSHVSYKNYFDTQDNKESHKSTPNREHNRRSKDPSQRSKQMNDQQKKQIQEDQIRQREEWRKKREEAERLKVAMVHNVKLTNNNNNNNQNHRKGEKDPAMQRAVRSAPYERKKPKPVTASTPNNSESYSKKPKEAKPKPTRVKRDEPKVEEYVPKKERVKAEKPREAAQDLQVNQAEIQQKLANSSVLYALWQRGQSKREGEKKNDNSIIEKPATAYDLNTVTFSPLSKFEEGEIVLAPRSRGGFNYARVDKQLSKKHCYFDPAAAHTITLWRVVYVNAVGKTLFKDLPTSYVGKLSEPGSEHPTVMESSDEKKIGEPPSSKDLGIVVFSAQNSFAAGEIVLVPHSGGGFTYGKLLQETKQNCKEVEPDEAHLTHTLNGWKVLVRDDIRKEVAAASLGKISFITPDSGTPRSFKAVSEPAKHEPTRKESKAKHGKQHKKVEEEEYIEPLEPATTEKEFFSIFGDMDIDQPAPPPSVPVPQVSAPVPVPATAPVDIMRDELDDIAQWGKNLTKVSPRNANTITSAEPVDLKADHVISPRHEARPVSVPTASVSAPAPVHTTSEIVQPSPVAIPLHQIGGILPIDKEELFKRLMDKNKRSKQSKHLIVIDGPNVARKHGKDTEFSSLGIKLALEYWNERGHDAIAFVPQQYVKRKPGSGPVTLAEFIPTANNVAMLLDLVEKGKLALTPPQDYDDSYCIEYAMNHNACIVTNDRYWDHIDKTYQEKAVKGKEVKKWIRDHTISFTFVRDEFLPNPNFKFPPL